MNFYASRGFLDAAAAVYFKARTVAVEDVRIGDDLLRLLVIDGKEVITRLLFLDYHQPLATGEIAGSLRQGRYAQRVSRGVIEASRWDPGCSKDMELAPFVDWSCFAGFEAFYEQLLARHHGLVRDRERRGRALVSKHGELTFTPDDRREDVLALARQWKGRQLREMGLPDYFDNPQTMAFLETLRERNLLTSSTLRAGGCLVSLWIGYVYEGSWSGWIFTYDQAYKKYSVGHQLLIRMLEESYRRGHREFDFSVGAQDYKMFYATHGRLLGAIGTPSLTRGVEVFASKIMRDHTPDLFAMALRARWCLSKVIKRNTGASKTTVKRLR